MEKIHFIKEIKNSTHSLVWQFAIQGVLLIALGVLVVYQPGILILLVSLILILVGLGSIWAAYKVRKVVKKFDKFFNLF